jgi:hypothetical protein
LQDDARKAWLRTSRLRRPYYVRTKGHGGNIVKIEFSTTGGVAFFPGLATPVRIDTDELPGDRRSKLEQLVADARFFELPAEAPPRRGADYQTHTIVISDGARRHLVRVVDPVADPALRALIQALRHEAQRRRQDHMGPDGQHQ